MLAVVYQKYTTNYYWRFCTDQPFIYPFIVASSVLPHKYAQIISLLNLEAGILVYQYAIYALK